MINKEKYRKFCKEEKDLPLYIKDWWLDAVCGYNNWDVAIVEKNNIIVGVMPYYIKKEGIFKTIAMPKLTQTMGPYIKYPKGLNLYKKLSWEKELFTNLIEQLPKVDSFTQTFNHQTTNWLPFYWKGFNSFLKYTYIIFENDLNKIYSNFQKKVRNEIKKAQKNDIKIVESDDIKSFYELNCITYEKQGVDVPYSFDFIKNIYETAKQHDAVTMKFAVKDDDILSISMTFRDNKYMYLIIGSSDRNKVLFGAEYLLDWNSINEAIERKLNFDFEGSMMERIEGRVRAFGAIPTPYLQVFKTDSQLWRAKSILDKVLKK